MDREAELILEQMESLESDLTSIREETNNSFKRVIDSIEHFSKNVKDIDAKFEEMTHLKKEDYVFILFCAGLQACRQYFITDFKERLTDSEAAKEVKGEKEEKSSRNKSRYYCSIKNMVHPTNA